ncbi:MAG: TIGR03915 family putative DNA repair protein, partial [Burkholderiaceae bacterium]
MSGTNEDRRCRSVAVRRFADWRDAARRLLAAGVPPEAVHWREAGGEGGLFDDIPDAGIAGIVDSAPASPGPGAVRLPRSALALIEAAACHRSSERWAFLYRVVWRWQRGEREALAAADPDGARLQAMARAVERETHKLHAYLRFRERPLDAGAPRFVAWFEPEHDVLERAAGHFAHRMGSATWMIGT